MAAEKAQALVLKTTDWSESSRIATLWTREFGKVRVLAKGGRRLKSNFESALDLLTVCSIVLLRKSTGSLDLLTEAQVVRRFPRLRTNLPALYAGYYIAELLEALTQDYDPHPDLYDASLAALEELGMEGIETGPRLARWEMTAFRELGFSPVLSRCAGCEGEVAGDGTFSPTAGGLVCEACRPGYRDKRPVSPEVVALLRGLQDPGSVGKLRATKQARGEVRQLLGLYVTSLIGRRPRLLPYLGS